MKAHLLAAVALVALTGAATAQEKTIRFAHDSNPDIYDNPNHACATVFANIVNTDTNGEITVELYPGGQIGTITEAVQMVRDGIVEMTNASTGSLAPYYANIDVLNLPFAFANNGATNEVFDGEFGRALKADMEEKLGDVVVLGYPDTGGLFAITNSKKEIATLEDMKGVRLRTMTLPSHQAIMNALGMEAYPLAFSEVYSGLQTGVIDGQMNPIPIIVTANLDEVQAYMTLTNHLYSPFTLLMNRSFYDELTDAQKDIVHYAAQSCVDASRGLSRIIEASDRGISGLKGQMTITALSPDDRQAMREVTGAAFDKHIEETLGPDAVALVDLLKAETEKANATRFMVDPE
ncbi:C4-dicarboxylate ABC transporter substrate-binding protein [Acuticoccus sediminis]|uniref:C4-dicarboxylate ABC transporter substrate-binding protein n=1 Tax=Acuticoccus sediminis TaxID=2184697 RepID=A0A8B2NIP9_9HYPH|nr:DctP family TRAP transporter solute-binding subunit [Acuticoccus sediminis]RAH97391.1 C4-dicarboxylate ABC transporter substrate-binding protein [Acuticoccus sediminis]